MVIDRRRFNFPFRKFKLDSERGLVYRLADYFDFSRRVYAEKEERRFLLRLAL